MHYNVDSIDSQMADTNIDTVQADVITSKEMENQDTEQSQKRGGSEVEKNDFKRQKVVVPEGMTKREYKRQLKQQRWEETKDEYKQKKREKKKAARERRKERIKEAETNGESNEELYNYHQMKRAKVAPQEQIDTDVKIIMDCEFDSLMNDKEIVSLSNQITRSYSAKKHSTYDVQLDITSFNKNLKKRFEKAIPQYDKWTNVTFVENDKLEDILPMDDKQALSKYVYLTADTDEVIDTLEPQHTYIIGGIVDKNRYKNLCLNKAQSLGLKIGRLPIDKFIKMNGRQVLATSHVFELCCKWFENDKDWGKAFNEVLPPRKVKGKLTHDAEPETSIEPSDASEQPVLSDQPVLCEKSVLPESSDEPSKGADH